MLQHTLFIALVLLLATASPAAEVVQRADLRFATPTEETPHFQRHVLPLMGRLGCNGRACHGSFQGQGGFRLSLFGYDFKMDHDALTQGDYSRVDLKNPEASMILDKPTGDENTHGGGHVLDVGSWQYHLLRAWVEGGAQPVDTEQGAHFVRLEVAPEEIVFAKKGETAQLKVLSHWSDGTVEDVTPLCRFQTNDESVAVIGADGQVQAVSTGDTHVVAFYDNGVVPVAVLLPVSDQVGENFPAVATPTKIDELVIAKLKKLGIVPSDTCGDAEFLRRASFDITGLPPSPDEVQAFLADQRADKRVRKIDELLASPAYAAWWSTKISDVLGNNERAAGNTSFRSQYAEQFYHWIYKRVAENMPYDDMIEGIVLAVGRTSEDQTYEQYCQEMSSMLRRGELETFAERPTLPHYWTRTNMRTPNQKALSFSYAMLGVRLQCAECHKHPFDQWSQDDFKQFEAFFASIANGTRDNEARDAQREMIEELAGGSDRDNLRQIRNRLSSFVNDGKTVPVDELYVNNSRIARNRDQGKKGRVSGSRVITPKVLGGEDVMLANYHDPREPLMEWLRSQENPYFAKAFVNRVWAHYFGVGIVEPPDDMNLANAPSNKELLDWLAEEFVARDYDMRWLHREICSSDTYQRSWRPSETNLNDTRNFARARPRRLKAESVYDAVSLATAGGEQTQAMRADPVEECAVGLSRGYYQARGRSRVGYALQVFGKPMRETPCDCERSDEATLLQTVFLRNDEELLGMIDRRGGWLDEVARSLGTPLAGAERDQKSRDDELRERQIAGARRQIASLERQLQALRKQKPERVQARKARLQTQLEAAEKELARLTPRARLASQQTVVAAKGVDETIREAYLRTVQRVPTAEELSEAQSYLAASPSTVDGLRDLLWALLNTKEFLVNH